MAKKMFFGISTHLGGAERSLLEFLKLYRREHNQSDFFVLLPKKEGPLVAALEELKVNFKVLSPPASFMAASRSSTLSSVRALLSLPGMFAYLYRLRKLIRTEAVETVHCTGLKCHMIACMLTFLVPARMIIHLRDILAPSPLLWFFNGFSKHPRITWLAASKAIAMGLRQISPKVVYDGMDESQFYPDRGHALQTELGLRPGTRLVGIVGVVAEWKGQRQFLRAAHAASHVIADCHFVVVGDQIYDTVGDRHLLEDLKSECKALGFTDRFHFVGFKKNTRDVYNSLDWLVHASIHPEPFGRVVVEALLCKTPVIAAGAGGILEIVEDEKTGLLHRPGDIENLTQNIIKALNMAAPARAKIADFGFSEMRRKYILEQRYGELKKIIDFFS